MAEKKTGQHPTELVVALDYPNAEQAEALIAQLAGLPVTYKVGLELFLSAGPQWVKRMTARGYHVFLDLKFHDIPNTVAQAVIQANMMGVEFVTVHLAGGKRMLDEIEIAFREAELSGKIKTRVRVLGVSVLTSFKEEEWIANVSQVAKLTAVRTIEESVLRYAALANDHEGVGGLVCSPKEVVAIRARFPDLFLMIPGIRLAGGSQHDQNRVMTPAGAKLVGASAIVVGRPIIQAPNPREVAEEILKDIFTL